MSQPWKPKSRQQKFANRILMSRLRFKHIILTQVAKGDFPLNECQITWFLSFCFAIWLILVWSSLCLNQHFGFGDFPSWLKSHLKFYHNGARMERYHQKVLNLLQSNESICLVEPNWKWMWWKTANNKCCQADLEMILCSMCQSLNFISAYLVLQMYDRVFGVDVANHSLMKDTFFAFLM